MSGKTDKEKAQEKVRAYKEGKAAEGKEGKKTAREPKITAGSIDKVVDLAFNPSRDKIREVTVIDRMQGRLLPQLDLIDLMWQYVIEVATFRYDEELYKTNYPESDYPIPPNLIEEFTYRTAQWQKSVGGKNLQSAIDLALAETETAGGLEDLERKADYFDDR